MRIENLRSVEAAGRTRVAASVTWEDCGRSKQDVFFETDREFGEGLTCNPHAFLTACIMPALRHGERRVQVDEAICPGLYEGLMEAMSVVRHWYKLERELVRIEAKARTDNGGNGPRARAGFFFSGGIDSLATLRLNRLNFPLSHPGSFQDGLLVFGFEVDQPQAFEHVVASVSAIAEDAGIVLIPVYTNARQLDDDWIFYRDQFQGALLAAVGHSLAGRLTSVTIAATYDIANLGPWGSHPLLDPNFGSSDLQIHHDGAALSRLAKTKLVADWDVALRHLRVCNKTEQYRPGLLNCGECEKCVRTMLALYALDALDKTPVFAHPDLSEDKVAAVWINDPYEESCYRDVIGPLEKRGRHDLVRGIRRAITRRREPDNLRSRLVRFDRAHLHSNLARFKRLITS